MDSDTFQGFVFQGLVWGIVYYFIRRGLNPEVEDLQKYKKDALYGGLSAFISAVIMWYVRRYVVPAI